MMKKFTLISAAVLSLSNTVSAQYSYDNSEDWIKVVGGAMTGIFTASIVEASENLCYKSAVSAADSTIDYSITGLKQKDSLYDWLMWAGTSVGSVAFFGTKALYYCLGTDPNFGWVKPVDYSNMDLTQAILSPWTLDFLISLVSVFTGVKAAIFDWDVVDPFYLSKKLAQGTFGSLLKLLQLIVFKSFGY